MVYSIFFCFWYLFKPLIQKKMKGSHFTRTFPWGSECPSWEHASGPPASGAPRGVASWFLQGRLRSPEGPALTLTNQGCRRPQAPPAPSFSLQSRGLGQVRSRRAEATPPTCPTECPVPALGDLQQLWMDRRVDRSVLKRHRGERQNPKSSPSEARAAGGSAE